MRLELLCACAAGAGRLVIELFDDIAPVAVMHFRNRCSGGHGCAAALSAGQLRQPGLRLAPAAAAPRCWACPAQARGPLCLTVAVSFHRTACPGAEGASDTFKGTAIHKLVRDMGAFGGHSARSAGMLQRLHGCRCAYWVHAAGVCAGWQAMCCAAGGFGVSVRGADRPATHPTPL